MAKSLKGLCLHLGKITDLQHHCFHMHKLDIMLNRFPKHMGSRELSDVWAEGRQKGPVDDHVFNGTMTDASHLRGMWDSWPMCNRTLTPYHWQRPHASFWHLNLPLQTHLSQGSQNFKIPGSPSGRYSSDFGSPKICLTSPNKKKTININQKYFQYTNINKYQEFYFTIYRQCSL